MFQFSSSTQVTQRTKSEGSSDEHCTDTLETIGKGTGITPVASSNVFVVLSIGRATTANTDNTDEDEHDDDEELQTGRPELFFGKTEGTENTNDCDQNPKDSDPYPNVHVRCCFPILYRCSSHRNFQRQYDSPLEDVVPAHGKCEGGVEEADSQSVETTGDGIEDRHFTKGLDNDISK